MRDIIFLASVWLVRLYSKVADDNTTLNDNDQAGGVASPTLNWSKEEGASINNQDGLSPNSNVVVVVKAAVAA